MFILLYEDHHILLIWNLMNRISSNMYVSQPRVTTSLPSILEASPFTTTPLSRRHQFHDYPTAHSSDKSEPGPLSLGSDIPSGRLTLGVLWILKVWINSCATFDDGANGEASQDWILILLYNCSTVKANKLRNWTAGWRCTTPSNSEKVAANGFPRWIHKDYAFLSLN